jgi:phage gpG-like protein
VITINIDSHAVTEALNRLASRVNNLSPALDDIGDSLVQNIQLNLGQGLTPWSAPFVPLKQPRRHGRGTGIGDVPLNDTRQHIYNAITHAVFGDSLSVGMNENSEIGSKHQFGSTEDRIPARPFLPIKDNQVILPNDWENEVTSIISHYLENS